MTSESAPIPEEVKIIDGVPHKKVYTGYTIREYFSHSTPEKGPGPGWDFREYKLRQLGFDPYADDLPDEPYYQWEEVTDDDE